MHDSFVPEADFLRSCRLVYMAGFPVSLWCMRNAWGAPYSYQATIFASAVFLPFAMCQMAPSGRSCTELDRACIGGIWAFISQCMRQCACTLAPMLAVQTSVSASSVGCMSFANIHETHTSTAGKCGHRGLSCKCQNENGHA